MCVNTNNYVVMSNNLIKSKSNLSLNELKLLRLTIMQVMADDTEFMTYTMPIVELGKILGLNDIAHLYREIDTMTNHLMQEIIYIKDENKKNKYKKIQWCSECDYDDGVITIRLHDKLKPYLLSLKGYYTQYVLEDILMLKSKYTIRIYELIREKMRKKVYADRVEVVELSINDIRIATNTETKYSQMGHFKKKVIEPAIKEMNDKLGYNIVCDDIKQSRKIVGFRFIIESKNNIHSTIKA